MARVDFLIETDASCAVRLTRPGIVQAMSRPHVRPTERDFVLLFIKREGVRPDAIPGRVIGFTVSVHFGRGMKQTFVLSASSADWEPVDSLSFDDWSTLLLVAEVFYRIGPEAWVGCHPERGIPLYGKPRSVLERQHRTLVRQVDLTRKYTKSMESYYQQRARWAGVDSPVT